jgi:peptide-methionine (S)-S-oxide reductase
VVTLHLEMTPENGFVPEPLFDASGNVSLVLGWGNYLPGLHELVEGLGVGDTLTDKSIDAGWGARQPELVVRARKDRLDDFAWKLGESFFLKGMQVWVTEDLGETVVLDANPPLAGASYCCSFTVLSIEDAPSTTTKTEQSSSGSTVSSSSSRYELASFALGCFWGADLAFSRTHGVVGTKVGYSQGITHQPTYDEVCEGRTQHRETVLVVFDPEIVSYADLLQLAVERLALTASPVQRGSSSAIELNRLFGDDTNAKPSSSSSQYRHGFYYFSEEQRDLARKEIASHNNRFGVELLQARSFYDAEEYHQKYLYKRGQSTRKGCREAIRCYG